MADTVVGQQNPGTLGSEYNVMVFVIAQLLAAMQTATVVKVISCTNSGGLEPVGRVTVQPMIMQFSSLQLVPHGEIAEVPYMRVQGGTDAFILDPKPDDLGVCVFASRDISNLKADPQGAVAAGGAAPGSRAQFDWADGLYLGGVLNGTPTQYVRFAAGLVEIVSPTKIRLAAPEIELAGAVAQTGGANSTFSGDVTANGISVHNHVHPGVTRGGSNTDPPT